MHKSNKKSVKTKETYSMLPHFLAQELNVDMNELCLLDIIYSTVAHNDNNWYGLHYETVMPMINVKRATLARMVNGLIKKNLLVRHPQNRGQYKTSSIYVNMYSEKMNSIHANNGFKANMRILKSESYEQKQAQ